MVQMRYNVHTIGEVFINVATLIIIDIFLPCSIRMTEAAGIFYFQKKKKKLIVIQKDDEKSVASYNRLLLRLHLSEQKQGPFSKSIEIISHISKIVSFLQPINHSDTFYDKFRR